MICSIFTSDGNVQNIFRNKFILFVCIISTFIACESSLTESNFRYDQLDSSEDINNQQVDLFDQNNPQALFNDFVEMVKKVESMSSAEIDSLDKPELLRLAIPIQKVTNSTTYFDTKILMDVYPFLTSLTRNYQSFSGDDYNFLNFRVEGVLKRNQGTATNIQFRSTRELRSIFKNWNSDTTEDKSCEDLFNLVKDYIVISPGDNLNIANYVCPDHTTFVLRSGTYINQAITKSKAGNRWIGLKNAILDGKNSIYRAFDGGLDQNTIALIEFRNYYLHGIYSLIGPADVTINRVTFRNIAPDSSGQDFGAIKLDNATNVSVTHSHFENVASAVRFRFSHGPLRVMNNTALNPGRNFFQCDKCQGPGIRINRNSLERTQSYGAATLEDWINIYQSSGTASDWIQVNNNRARGHSLSGSGSFIILGDDYGNYQEAVGNIGVNPGQVGIGIAGGHNIKVEANKMFSVEWDSSNVAFYSANYSLTQNCSKHLFPGPEASEPNRANWICGDSIHCKAPAINYAWTDGKCGVNLEEIRSDITVDRSMGPEIWDEW